MAGFISEWWPESNRNGGRLQIGIPGRIDSEFAANSLVNAGARFMHCYFLHDGHIAGVETLAPELSDEDAIARAHILFSKRKAPFDGFEVWDRARFVFRLPPSAETVAPSWHLCGHSSVAVLLPVGLKAKGQ
jgi:hypothetical protein